MIDAPTSWLIQQIKNVATTQSLWFSDENVLRQLSECNAWKNKPQLFTNRWDIAEQAIQSGFISHFNDFDLNEIADNSIDHIFYRISKEKAITHHLINEAARILKQDGILWLSGQKNEGIKTYGEKACLLFGCEKNIQKDGMNYSSMVQKIHIQGAYLNDENYPELRECFRINEQTIYSKPGQFGWNKIDAGSEFLIAEITRILTIKPQQFNHCLDLGCGYGYLTIASQSFAIKAHSLTDNNAAALRTAEFNCNQNGIKAEVIGSDAGQQINQVFDLLLCNPPFHQGFSVDGDLTDKFLHNAQRLLTANGVAYFVVNQFIPLEKKAELLFKSVKLIARNAAFKVIELRKS